MYGTGNSIQYSVIIVYDHTTFNMSNLIRCSMIIYVGKESEKETCAYNWITVAQQKLSRPCKINYILIKWNCFHFEKDFFKQKKIKKRKLISLPLSNMEHYSGSLISTTTRFSKEQVARVSNIELLLLNSLRGMQRKVGTRG